MSLFDSKIKARVLADQLCELLQDIPEDERIAVLNEVRATIAEASPFRAEPVDLVLWVPNGRVLGNEYNPNAVAPPEMKLLERSVRKDGYTQPLVTWPESDDVDRVVDGFHRKRVGTDVSDIRARVHGHLPITRIRSTQTGIDDRMAATIRHNRARGEHGVDPMQKIVIEMLQHGATDLQVAEELGMDAEEVLRFRQTSGIPGLFTMREYSKSWK